MRVLGLRSFLPCKDDDDDYSKTFILQAMKHGQFRKHIKYINKHTYVHMWFLSRNQNYHPYEGSAVLHEVFPGNTIIIRVCSG